jgi:deoxyuridine 5'-triphosphate nucleotidohydrolase
MKGEFYNRLKLEYEQQQLVAYILCGSEEEATKLGEYSKQTCGISSVEQYKLNEGIDYHFQVKWYSSDAIDLLIWLNNGTELFNHVLCPLPISSLQFKYKKSDSDAIPPSRAHGSDSGFDLTLIKLVKTVGDVSFYSTGIQVEPPHGYYFDMVPRSFISKSGYTLANCVGIIDQNYRGDIIVPLRKTDPNANDIKLPCKIVQLIPRQWIHITPVETTYLDITSRGEEGFGSTNQ